MAVIRCLEILFYTVTSFTKEEKRKIILLPNIVHIYYLLRIKDEY